MTTRVMLDGSSSLATWIPSALVLVKTTVAEAGGLIHDPTIAVTDAVKAARKREADAFQADLDLEIGTRITLELPAIPNEADFTSVDDFNAARLAYQQEVARIKETYIADYEIMAFTEA
jgi:hypothetical protein